MQARENASAFRGANSILQKHSIYPIIAYAGALSANKGVIPMLNSCIELMASSTDLVIAYRFDALKIVHSQGT